MLQVLSTHAQQQQDWGPRPTCAHEDSSLLCDLQASFSEAVRGSSRCGRFPSQLPHPFHQLHCQTGGARPSTARRLSLTSSYPPASSIVASRRAQAQRAGVYMTRLPPRPPATQGMLPAARRAAQQRTRAKRPDEDMARQLRKLFFKEIKRKQRKSFTGEASTQGMHVSIAPI